VLSHINYYAEVRRVAKIAAVAVTLCHEWCIISHVGMQQVTKAKHITRSRKRVEQIKGERWGERA